MTVVILLEYSRSGNGYYASEGASWAQGFLDKLEPGDWVALMTYDLNATVRVDFTHNRAEVRDSLASLGFPAFSDANLFDAVTETLDKLEKVRGRKTILLLSTGANNFSEATLDDLMKRLRGTDVTIFAVGHAEEEFTRSAGSSIGYLQARSWLQAICAQTGGIAFFPRFPGEMTEIFRSVTGFLRNEYTLSFTPAKENRDGKYHKLDVRVVGPEGKSLVVRDQKGRNRKLTVIARPGYLAPRSPVAGTSSGLH